MRWLIRTSLAVLAVLALLALGVGGFVWSYSGDYPRAAMVTQAAALAPLEVSGAVAPTDRTVVLLVFDGLSPALVRSVASESLARIAREGASTLAMRPVFPTLSLPNHTSLSTGCYPERHGVVSNRFIDPARGLYAVKGDAAWVEACEHLSEVVERQGIRAAVYGWMGAHRGDRLLVSHGGPLEQEVPAINARMTEVIAAFEREGARSRFIAGYTDEPDQTQHFKGIDAAESRAVMKQVDAGIARVLAAIDRAQAWDRTALIVTTDHGMTPVTTHLNVGGLLDRAGIEAEIAADGSIAHVYLEDSSTRDAAVAKLQGSKYFDVLVPGSMPDWAHLGSSRRLGDFVISMKPPYYVFDRGLWPAHLRFAAGISPDELTERTLAASHGYPPDVEGMEAVFFAMGAGVAKGASLDGLRTIDVHPTIAKLLGVEPGKPLDGQPFQALLATQRSSIVTNDG